MEHVPTAGWLGERSPRTSDAGGGVRPAYSAHLCLQLPCTRSSSAMGMRWFQADVTLALCACTPPPCALGDPQTWEGGLPLCLSPPLALPDSPLGPCALDSVEVEQLLPFFLFIFAFWTLSSCGFGVLFYTAVYFPICFLQISQMLPKCS